MSSHVDKSVALHAPPPELQRAPLILNNRRNRLDFGSDRGRGRR